MVMTIHVNIGEAKTRFSELCAAALRGEEVIVQNAGVPKLKLVPIDDIRAQLAEALVAKRKAALADFAEKYRHLHGTDALEVPPSMTDDEADERFNRKFGAPAP